MERVLVVSLNGEPSPFSFYEMKIGKKFASMRT
jgi:hypothetical protein